MTNEKLPPDFPATISMGCKVETPICSLCGHHGTGTCEHAVSPAGTPRFGVRYLNFDENAPRPTAKEGELVEAHLGTFPIGKVTGFSVDPTKEIPEMVNISEALGKVKGLLSYERLGPVRRMMAPLSFYKELVQWMKPAEPLMLRLRPIGPPGEPLAGEKIPDGTYLLLTDEPEEPGDYVFEGAYVESVTSEMSGENVVVTDAPVEYERRLPVIEKKEP